MKNQSLEYRHPTSPRKIKFRTQPSAANAHNFLGLQRYHSPAAHDQRYKTQLQDLSEDPKEVETMNQSDSSVKKADASSTDHTLVLPLQWQ